MYQIKHLFTLTENRSVRLAGTNQIAEVFYNGQWSPICGHWFWNNNVGASLFCKEAGYDSGAIKRDMSSNAQNLAQKTIRFELESDGLRIGQCNLGDNWLQCSGTCNDLEIGGNCADNNGNNVGSCRQGKNAAVSIDCFKRGRDWCKKNRLGLI